MIVLRLDVLLLDTALLTMVEFKSDWPFAITVREVIVKDE